MSVNLTQSALSLRPVRHEDSEMLLTWRNHPSVRQAMYSGHVIEGEEHRKWFEKILSDETYAWFVFEISGEPTGIVGFSGLKSPHGRAQWTFYLRPDKRVSGSGTALGLLALQQIFDVMGVRKLEGEVLADNTKSLHFHQRLGFRNEGVRLAHIHKDGQWHDVYEFSMLSDEWKALRPKLLEKMPQIASNSETYRARPRLLFTGGGGSASQSIQAQWGERYDLWFADANPNNFPPSIPESRRLQIPFARDPNFCTDVLEICKKHSIDVVVPGVDEELLSLAEKKNDKDWPHILVPDADFVSMMLDKLTCAQALSSAGLNAPKTIPLAQAEEIGFPQIAKPRTGRGSRGVMRLDCPQQVPAYLALQGGAADAYISQELIGGAEYTVFVAADGGTTPRAIIPVRAFEKRGVTVRAQTDANPAILAYAKAFQAHFRPSGCYNIQCMLTDDGRVFPFEVNPRISTTFVLAIATGFDPIPMALGEPAEATFIPQKHLTLQRSWHTHIANCETGEN
ncbi:MAG: UDP-4-amino-4,6-dideoxy-N-acetyl-beta-L-altrosamine N-acetyltransferase [Stappia sp.]|uniref:UDP-4-amino-4, 6-dideoxy-N-acetyl-beta-L-altrosamine N-acetyltransferase n=1 Tax=Stappia sp. TaxID=1870903 RepID=UPI000C3CBDF8|nr:UDP-4-amino-4,6-dideoxy-N-acetyl-beta-L-altrosamine N-acetyltransferase [Stappia sp.]MAA97840.1 UDP-4-amino-4,6-dideoxy-N-acetyl-beta-L-altrosamine N-acetyltransferase [Stappia sp.]MBM20822.1 UDP-4-amino-4,6-dideoxy-N-acetyl-beta-L-altrosamine N-acetyltransferase [Stappia sp.]